MNIQRFRIALACGVMAGAFAFQPVAAQRPQVIHIAKMPLGDALKRVAQQTGANILFSQQLVDGLLAPAIDGRLTAGQAVESLLAGTGLQAVGDGNGGLLIRRAQDPHRDGGAKLRPAADQATPAVLESAEIVVTAQRRVERAQDVPSSLTVLNGASLASRGALSLADYARDIPTLNIIGSGGAGTGQPTIRAVSTGADRASGVGIYLDDAPFTPSSAFSGAIGYSFDPDLSDIDRIEVLAGPQSTLYGASAMGGLIRYISKQPSLTTAGGSARLFVSAVDGGSLGGGGKVSLDVPIETDKLGLSASGFWRRDPGFIDNLARGTNINRANVFGGRLALRAKLTDTFETTLIGLVQNIDRRGPDQVYLTAGLKPIVDRSYTTPLDLPTHIRYRAAIAQSTLNLDFAQLTNILSYSNFFVHFRSDYSFAGAAFGAPTTGAAFDGAPVTNKYTEELRLASKPGRVEWVIGGFLTRETNGYPVLVRGTDASGNILPTTSPLYNYLTYNVDSTFVEKAAYGDLTVHLTPKLAVAGGIRYSTNHQTYGVNANGLLANANLSSKANDSATSYQATVTYQPTRQLTLYAKTASAYRPGGINPLSAAQIAANVPTTYRADTLKSYEVGAKGSALDGRLSFTVDAFHMDWSDIQLSQLVNGFSAVTNAAGARVNGAEASLIVRAMPGLTATLSADYLDAKYTGSAPTANVFRGNPLPYAPKFSGVISLDYSRPQPGRMTPLAGASFSHRAAQFVPLSSNTSFRLPPYDQLDLRAGVEWSRYRILARVSNVTNRFGLASASFSSAAGRPIAGAMMQPRTYTLAVETHF